MQEIFANLTHEQLKKNKEIGCQLREARENLKYTLDYVSGVIRIPVHSIQQLEKGNFGALESVIFLKGFLRNYCNFIKVDSAPFFEVINEFIFDTAKPNQPFSSTSIQNKNIWKKPFLVNFLFSAIVVGAVSVGIYFLFFFNLAQKEQVKLQNIKSNISQKQEQPQNLEANSYALSLSAKKDGWVRISANENRLFEIFLKAEVKYRWNVKKTFSITLATADLAEVLLNDKKPKDIAGKNELLFLDINSFSLADEQGG